MKIVPKINLNKDAQTAENGGLVFAKDIRLDEQLNIRHDYGHTVVTTVKEAIYDYYNVYAPKGGKLSSPVDFEIVGNIVGLNRIYFFIKVVYKNIINPRYPNIPASSDEKLESNIVEYNEIENTASVIKCGWQYGLGSISGCVSTNNVGDIILSIAETEDTVKPGNKTPLKHINLTTCELNDNETIYTQAPKVPITNISLEGYYNTKIPTGVYIFYVRYEIKDDVYTPWYLASRPLFTGYQTKTETVLGGLKHLNLHTDSNLSFILNIKSVFVPSNISYKNIQLGFVLSHDDGNFARSWKKFEYNDSINVNFTYEKEDIEEINIDDLQLPVFDIYNAENLINNNNKLICSNYKEDSIDDDIINLAKELSITLEAANQPDFAQSQTTKYYLNNREINKTTEDNISIGSYKDGSSIKNYVKMKSYTNLVGTNLFGITHYYYEGAPTNETADDNTTLYPPMRPATFTNKGTITVDRIFAIDQVFITNAYEFIFKPLNGDNNVYKIVFGAKVSDILNWGNQLNSKFSDTFRPDSNGSKVNINNTLYNYGQSAAHMVYNEFTNAIHDKCQNSFGIIDNVPKILLNLFPQNVNNNYKKTLYINNIEQQNINVKDYFNNNIKNTCYLDSMSVEMSKLLPETDVFDRQSVVYDIYTRGINYSFNFNYNISVSTIFSNNVINSTTFMPCSRYNFYIHFVKDNGYITPGIKINNNPISYTDVIQNNNTIKVIYPKLTGNDFTFPYDDYKAFFISIGNANDKLSHLMYRGASVRNENTYKHIAYDSIEADTLLYPITNTVKVIERGDLDNIDDIQVNKGYELNTIYHPSCDPSDIDYFEKPGYLDIAYDSNITFVTTKNYFALIGESDYNDSYLIKISPYCSSINEFNSFIHYNQQSRENDITKHIYDYYLGSFICNVSKLNFNINNIILYTHDGNQGIVDTNSSSGTASTPTRLYCNSNEIYQLITPQNTKQLSYATINAPLPYQEVNEVQIYSQFNLNCLSLQQDLQSVIRGYTTKDGDIEVNQKQIIVTVDSNSASSILELKSMFYNFNYQTFSIYDETIKQLSTFNNTLRISDVIQDETNLSVPYFHPLSYKHIPTNRGPIVLLFGLNNSVYIHTTDALFKIDQNATMNTQENTQIQLGQPDLENLIVKEIFDSKVGFAGISNKQHACVLFSNYIFYDKRVNKIYAYGGDTQITCISDFISNILNNIPDFDLHFANDEVHDRFFINCKILNTNSNVCISYNLRSKSFISIHSFDFKNAISTRSNTYLLTDITTPIEYTEIVKIDITKLVYNNYYLKTSYVFNINSVTVNSNTVNIDNKSIIDIIFNNKYEQIDVLNAINWICSKINNNDISFVENNGEQNQILYPGDAIRLITDSTYTHYIDLTIGTPINGLNDYDKLRYNAGIWTINNFRDEKQKDSNNAITDIEKSLIYGKYFIIRFILSGNFKFENIFINSQDYEKI